MTCDINGARSVLNKSMKRANKLAETMAVTREGEVLADTKASIERATALLDAKDFDGLAEYIKNEFSSTLSTAVAKQNLGGRFQASIAVSPKKGMKKVTYILKSAEIIEHEDYGKVVSIKVTPDSNPNSKPITYYFSRNSPVSHSSKASNSKIRIEDFGIIHDRITRMVDGTHADINRVKNSNKFRDIKARANKDIDKAESVSDIVGSSSNYKESDFKYKKLSQKKDYKHGDVTHMKNILADLNAIGSTPADSKLYEYYDKLLGSMHQGFFRDMNLYINENEDTANGWVDIKKEHILINASKTTKGMSNAEVYMHEVIHTMTHWALKNKNPQATRLKQRLNFLRARAFKEITWQKLKAADSSLSVQRAKELFDYIFKSDNADDEFLAHALTNPAVMSLLEKVKLKDDRKGGLLNVIKDFFSDLMNAVMGNYKFAQRNSDIKQEVHALAFMMAEVNGKAEMDLDTNVNPITSAISTIGNLLTKTDGKIEELISKLVTFTFDDKGQLEVPKNMNTVQKIMFFTKFFAKSIYNTNYRHEAGRFFSYYGLDASSSVREAVRSVLPPIHNHITIAAEFLGLRGSDIDRLRNNHVVNVAKSLIDEFTTKPTDSEQEAVTSILMEANGSTLFNTNKNGGKGYSTAQVIKLIKDTGYRKQTIAKLKRKVHSAESEEANWINGQAEGLGVFMATGKGHKAQNSNSENIVKGYLSNTRRKADEGLLAIVEEIAALTAIEHQGSTNRTLVATLLKSEEKGMRNTVRLYEAFKENSKKLFKGDESHQMEGYIKQLYSDDIETAYAVMSEREELEKQGFVLRSISEPNDLSGAEAVGFFVSGTNTRAERLSGAVALGNPSSRGMTLKEVRYKQFADSKKHAHVWFEADKAKYDSDAVEINKQLSAGVSHTDIEEGPVPVLDSTGNVVDYRNMMGKRDKRKYLKQNTKLFDVLAKTSGTIIDKIERAKQNEKVLKVITKNLRDVHDNDSSVDNQLEYTYLSATDDSAEIRKLFFQLPDSFRKLANSRLDKSLPIPNILMDQYFGYSQVRFTDMPGIKNLPGTIKRILNMIEKVWVDIVKIAKGNILLKMPIVLVKNIVSNILYAISTGTNPIELIKAYASSIKDVDKFMRLHRSLEAKKVELLSLSKVYGTTKFKDKEEQNEYNDEVSRLRAEIKRMEKEGKEFESLSELFDMGLYQAVIEDVSMYNLGDTNVVTDTIDGFTNKMPSVIRTPLQILFLSKETDWYKSNQYILQMSDLVARDVMNKKMKMQEEKQANGKGDLPLWYRQSTGNLDRTRAINGMGQEERKAFFAAAKLYRHETLLKSFVNYSKPNGKIEEWLNRLGVLMFTKYIKRIQHVISEASTKHAVTTIITMAAAVFALDAEMIQNSSIFSRIGGDFGVLGITPLYSPTDIVELVAVPPLLRLFNEMRQ